MNAIEAVRMLCSEHPANGVGLGFDRIYGAPEGLACPEAVRAPLE